MSMDAAGWQAEHQYRTQQVRRAMPHRRRHAPDHPRRKAAPMDTHSATARFEAALSQQLALAADPAVEAAGAALRATLAPAARQLALELAEQAANEVGAQLHEQEVEVVLREGEPTLLVREAAPGPTPSVDEDLEARITLRLPPSLKARLEESAGEVGDSVNTFVLKALAARAARPKGPGRRFKGTVQT